MFPRSANQTKGQCYDITASNLHSQPPSLPRARGRPNLLVHSKEVASNFAKIPDSPPCTTSIPYHYFTCLYCTTTVLPAPRGAVRKADLMRSTCMLASQPLVCPGGKTEARACECVSRASSICHVTSAAAAAAAASLQLPGKTEGTSKKARLPVLCQHQTSTSTSTSTSTNDGPRASQPFPYTCTWFRRRG
ncbi:predicted protein [Plenodomus lingam JN3]|uniref:Predicted protein n=1 Tax=Leptosphaeria maculans (strain JN3 / isolate v23.1.3 / race Av1-4-5-6-7-8) TaxID=985895 RepID=E4ZUH6_LEPMJ|nr:predicted protein [Plenodomus lingam JN3]CBX95055.1 predicted protein [Plenodomus lingam JN3]